MNQAFQSVMKENPFVEFDCIVIGAGPAGFAASVEAARSGLSVLLIEQLGFPGGIASASLCPHIMGYTEAGKQLVKGIADEFARSLDRIGCAAFNRGDEYEMPIGDKPLTTSVITTKPAVQYTMNAMLDAAKVKTLYYTSLIAVERDGNRIAAVYVNCREGIIRIPARVFIDATGDAHLVHRAGGETREHDPEESMTKTLLMHVNGVKDFKRSETKTRFRELSKQGLVPVAGQDNFMGFSIPMHPGETHLNFTMTAGNAVTSAACTEMDKELRRQAFDGIAWFKKNFKGFESAYLADIADMIGIRAARNIVGKATVTEKAILADEAVTEPVVNSKCYYGDHYSKSFSASWAKTGGVRAVPFGAMLPVTLSNVIAAGRNISSEPRVITTFRLMATCMGLGQAAGITAAYAVEKIVNANEVPYSAVSAAFREKGVLYHD
ncbi:MAG: FAD-dependent oxidoreductase [Spirochaetes bacterium]|nr:FAD-dependent oxidoreductase [Spirochaetota bacterium]